MLAGEQIAFSEGAEVDAEADAIGAVLGGAVDEGAGEDGRFAWTRQQWVVGCQLDTADDPLGRVQQPDAVAGREARHAGAPLRGVWLLHRLAPRTLPQLAAAVEGPAIGGHPPQACELRNLFEAHRAADDASLRHRRQRAATFIRGAWNSYGG